MAYTASSTLVIKRHNTFSLIMNYQDDAGKPLSLANTDIDAYLKDMFGNLIGQIDVRVIDESNGVAELTIPTDLPETVNNLFADVRLKVDGTVRNSDIVQLVFKDVVTHG